MMKFSLVPRPFKRRRRKGLVHTACACAGVSIATGCVTIVIACGFCMTYSSTGDKWRVYGSIQLPHIFLGSPGACACNVYMLTSWCVCVLKIMHFAILLHKFAPAEEGYMYGRNQSGSLIIIIIIMKFYFFQTGLSASRN